MHQYFGVDKSGRPFYVDRIGKADAHTLLKNVTQDELGNQLIYQYELLLKHKFLACSHLYD